MNKYKTVIPKIKTIMIDRPKRRAVKYDFLKNITVIKRWVKAKHGLTDLEFELILFLYSEKLFTRKQIEGYSTLIPWDKDRFYKMIKNGWIHEYRERTYSRLPVYELTRKAKLVVAYVYKMMTEEVPLPVNVRPGISQKRNAGEKIITIVPGTKNQGPKRRSESPKKRRVV